MYEVNDTDAKYNITNGVTQDACITTIGTAITVLLLLPDAAILNTLIAGVGYAHFMSMSIIPTVLGHMAKEYVNRISIQVIA